MDNETLVKAIRGGEVDKLGELYTQNRGLIHRIVERYRGYEEIDDLMQVAFLGLVEAVKNYNSESGALFMSYAPYWIKAAINLHLVNNGKSIRVPSYISDRIRKYKRTVERLEVQGIQYDDDYICSLMCLKPEELEEVKAFCMKPASLDKPIGIDDDSLTLGDTVRDSKDDIGGVLDKVEHEELRRELWGCVDGLPAEQAEIIHGKYQNGKTFVEMGEGSQKLHDKGLRELRKPKYRKRLLPFVEVFSRGIRGVGVGAFRKSWTSATEKTAIMMVEGR